MLKNYIKTALRNLWKNKGFSAINIIGLATGIATCLVILLFVTDELSYDKFNVNAEYIYSIDEQVKFGDNTYEGAQTPFLMGPTYAKDYPQILQYTRILRNWGGLAIKVGDQKMREN